MPWGMSESGYNTVDVHLNYQYRAFGVPGLGLKRGLAEDLVVAPYASALALMVAPRKPHASTCNVWPPSGLAGRLRFVRGDRLHTVAAAPRRNERRGPVVHGASPGHELAVAGLCASGAPDADSASSQIRYCRATLLLLQERIPRAALFHPHATELSDLACGRAGPARCRCAVLTSPDTTIPEVQLLSNWPLLT